MSEADVERSHGNPLLGSTLHDRFGLVGISGFGGSTTVFDAWDEETRTRAAVKVLRLESGDRRAADALRNEFTATKELEGVLGVPRARAYFDERVAGAQVVAFARDFAEPLSRAVGVHDVDDWATTLASAHARGRVHGDLAPDHFFTGVIIDWGSSSVIGSAEPAIGFHHRTASVEVLRGEPATPASDWHAFAASVRVLVGAETQAELGLEGFLEPDPSARVEAAITWLAGRRRAAVTPNQS